MGCHEKSFVVTVVLVVEDQGSKGLATLVVNDAVPYHARFFASLYRQECHPLPEELTGEDLNRVVSFIEVHERKEDIRASVQDSCLPRLGKGIKGRAIGIDVLSLFG